MRFMVPLAMGALTMMANAAHAACLPHATPVALEGTLTAEEHPGPPNDDGTAANYTYYFIHLAQAICLDADQGAPGFSPDAAHANRVQVVGIKRRDVPFLVGRNVSVKGGLFHAETEHDPAQFVLFATKVEKK